MWLILSILMSVFKVNRFYDVEKSKLEHVQKQIMTI